jgi:hypothetical protein
MTRRFTPEDARMMTPEEVLAFWRQRQIEDRDAGRPHYTKLVDVHRDGTETVVSTIDEVAR